MAFIFTENDPQIREIVQQLKVKSDISVSFSYIKNAPLQISKVENCARITYGSRVELFRGLGLLAEHSDELRYETTQKAYFTMNGAMLDCSRNGVVNLQTAKQLIRYMALMGQNMLMLYTEDTYEVPEYPYFGYMRGRYTQKELQELDAYAQGYGIELIPCIQTLAHLAATLRWMCFDDIKEDSDTLLVGEEKTYEFIEAMIRACRKCFHTKRIHIGMDEAFMLGLGKYRVKNGIRRREEIFCEHLSRVNKICHKYGFSAMIWSDMFYRMAFGGNDGDYATGGNIAKEVMDMVPENVDLVYWDYYKHGKELYRAPMKSHKEFRNNIIFAGGAWRWAGFAPHIVKSLDISRDALAVCKEYDIREVICTAWGDQGNECPVMTILPVLQLYAELSYQENVTPEILEKRLYACTGESLTDMLCLDDPDMPDGNYHEDITNPATYLLYSDVLGSLFELHTEDCYKMNYAAYAKRLEEAAARSKNLGYMYDMLAKLCSVLEYKAGISADTYKAYQTGDREILHFIAERILPETVNRLEDFRNSVEVRWQTEYKMSGYDVLDFRIGGVSARVKSAIRRLNAYLHDEIDKIEELEEKRLPFNCVSEEKLKEDPIMCWSYRNQIVSANNL